MKLENTLKYRIAIQGHKITNKMHCFFKERLNRMIRAREDAEYLYVYAVYMCMRGHAEFEVEQYRTIKDCRNAPKTLVKKDPDRIFNYRGIWVIKQGGGVEWLKNL